MMDWMPIETAPKDGTWFMAARRGEGPEEYEIGCYDPQTWDEYVPADGGLFRKETRVINEWRGFNNLHRMTDWMPLPEPPHAHAQGR